MPILIVEFFGKRKRTELNGRASIGRTAHNDIIIDHPAVSRIHAVIECANGAYVIQDTGSKNGTIVGSHKIHQPHTLVDGDRIAIGPAVLTFRNERLAADESESSPLTETHAGMLMDCECGAKLWVPREMVGGRGQCQTCGRTLTLGQSAAPAVAPPPQVASTTARTCSICQWKIEPTDVQHTCPSCGLVFHHDCWMENRGCSAYGCAQVNALDQSAQDAAETEEIGHPPVIPQAPRFPWEFAMLAASLVASLLGLLIFGVLALVTMIASGMYLLRHGRRSRAPVLLGAMGVSLAGLIAGIVVSCFWWLRWKY